MTPKTGEWSENHLNWQNRHAFPFKVFKTREITSWLFGWTQRSVGKWDLSQSLVVNIHFHTFEPDYSSLFLEWVQGVHPTKVGERICIWTTTHDILPLAWPQGGFLNSHLDLGILKKGGIWTSKGGLALAHIQDSFRNSVCVSYFVKSSIWRHPLIWRAVLCISSFKIKNPKKGEWRCWLFPSIVNTWRADTSILCSYLGVSTNCSVSQEKKKAQGRNEWTRGVAAYSVTHALNVPYWSLKWMIWEQTASIHKVGGKAIWPCSKEVKGHPLPLPMKRTACTNATVVVCHLYYRLRAKL